MLRFKHYFLFIFLFFYFNQTGISQYNPSLNITNFNSISIDGYVSYSTTNADPEDARFTLFGDGYFGFENSFVHYFPNSNDGFTTKTYFNRRYKKDPPIFRTKSTGPTTNTGSGVNTRININSGSNTRVATSWSPCLNIENYYLLIFENTSNTIDEGCIEFYFNDSELNLNSTEILEYGWVSNRTASIVSGMPKFNQKLRWEFSNLIPGEQRVIYIPMTSLLDEGEEITVGSKYLSDCILNDNGISNETMLSKGSPHDPNTKIADKKYVSSRNIDRQEITYTIQFQNEGNGVAQNIVLEDVIDDRFLEVESLEFLEAEYEFSYSLIKNVLSIEFKDINLPGLKQSSGTRYSYDDTESYIKFKISTKSYLEEGEILNQAAIFFDNQEAINTNVSIVKIKDTQLSSNNIDIKIGPNPVENLLFIEGIEDKEVSISMYDNIGRLVLLKSGVTKSNRVISMEQLTSGIYYVMISNDNISVSKKVVKL